MKCERRNRTLVITEIPDYAHNGGVIKAPARIALDLTYWNDDDTPRFTKGIFLDNIIIPAIVKALNHDNAS